MENLHLDTTQVLIILTMVVDLLFAYQNIEKIVNLYILKRSIIVEPSKTIWSQLCLATVILLQGILILIILN